MGEHLEQKLARLKAKLYELHRNLPVEDIPLSMLLEIEALEREISYLTSDTSHYDDETIH